MPRPATHGKRPCVERVRGFHAFTLIELLVVIAVIGILAALLFPALTLSRSRAQAITCMSNSRHLAMAWTMYTGDNGDRLVYNLSSDSALRTLLASAAPSWVNNVMDWNASPDNTNMAFVSHSVLAPYAGNSAAIFHCPSDRALSPVQMSLGWSGRVRSESMNALVGDPGNPSSTNSPSIPQYLKESDLPDPSMVFVFLDEHPDSINDGTFLNTYASTNALQAWTSLPASYHDGAGSFSFADGHTEIHRWSSASTVRPPTPGGAGLPLLLRADDTTDFMWVMSRTVGQ